VVAVKVGEEDDIDGPRVDAELLQMRQQGRAGVEQDVPVYYYPGVVTLDGERRSRPQEGDLQAIVTPGNR
jgi:hypothetical protein